MIQSLCQILLLVEFFSGDYSSLRDKKPPLLVDHLAGLPMFPPTSLALWTHVLARTTPFLVKYIRSVPGFLKMVRFQGAGLMYSALSVLLLNVERFRNVILPSRVVRLPP